MFIVSVIVYSNCHIMQFLHQMFNVSALLLDDALKPATLLTNGAINETLQQFAPLNDDQGLLRRGNGGKLPPGGGDFCLAGGFVN